MLEEIIHETPSHPFLELIPNIFWTRDYWLFWMPISDSVRRTDRRTDKASYRVAFRNEKDFSLLDIILICLNSKCLFSFFEKAHGVCDL